MALWGKKDDAVDAPKFLRSVTTHPTIQPQQELENSYFVDYNVEAVSANNRSHGIKTAGWNQIFKYNVYNAASNTMITRTRVEPLIPMKVAAAVAGDQGTTVIAATALVANTSYIILSTGTSNFTLVGAATNTVGTIFTANGATTGTGTVGYATGDNYMVANT